MAITYRILLLVLVPSILAHPVDSSAEEAEPHQLSSLARSTSTPSTLTTQAVVSPTPAAWNPELKRQENDRSIVSCGFISVDTSSLVSCPLTDQRCVVDGISSVRGCCDTRLDLSLCAIPTACVPFKDYQSCSGSCSTIPEVTTCTDTASPFCYTNLVLYGRTVTLAEYGCGRTSTTNTIYLSTVPSNSSTVVPSGTARPTDSGGPQSIPTDFNIGATIGGVVGGCAVVAILAYWAYSRRKRKQRVATDPSLASPSSHVAAPTEKQSVASAPSSEGVPGANKPGTVPDVQRKTANAKAAGRKAYTSTE